MPIPCGDDDHWRLISLLFVVQQESLTLDDFQTALGGSAERDSWLLVDRSETPYHSHALVRSHGPPSTESDKEGKSEGEAVWMIEVETFRAVAETAGDHPVVTHHSFLKALADSISSEEVFVASYLELVFRSEDASWRTALLADPPELGELREDLGRITLSGLTLRFRDSVRGLTEARLEVSPSGEKYRTALQFSSTVKRVDLPNLYETVLRKAEGFAALFVDISDR